MKKRPDSTGKAQAEGMMNQQKSIVSLFVGLAFILLQVAESYTVSHGPPTLHMDSGTISFVYSAASTPSPPPQSPERQFVVVPLEVADGTPLFPETHLYPPQQNWQDFFPSRASPFA